jgi:hypothetical protein
LFSERRERSSRPGESYWTALISTFGRVRLSGPIRLRTARTLVSVPPILFGSIDVSGWPAKWVWMSP